MKIDWTTDTAGRMLGFGYHDASLTGLEWEDKRHLRLTFATPGGITTVEMSDLDTVTLRDVWNGLIVSDMFAWPITSVPEAVWDIADGAWHSLLAGRVHKADERSKAAEIIRRKPSGFLVQVLSSYGGTLAAVCGSITVRTEAPP